MARRHGNRFYRRQNLVCHVCKKHCHTNVAETKNRKGQTVFAHIKCLEQEYKKAQKREEQHDTNV